MTIRITIECPTAEDALAALIKLGATTSEQALEGVAPAKPKSSKKTKGEPAEPSAVVGGVATQTQSAPIMPSITDMSTTSLAQPAPAPVQTPVTPPPAAAAPTELQLKDVIDVLTLVGQKKSLGREALVNIMAKYSTNAAVTGVPKDKYAACVAEAKQLLAAAP